MYYSPSCPRTILVYGEGRVSASPDEVTLNIGVVTENKELQIAQQENSERMNNVLDTLYSLGIEASQIQTSDYQINMEYDYLEGHQQFRAYRVVHQLKVTTYQLHSVGEIVDTAVASGANFVSSIQFSVKDKHGLYNQALSDALVDAYRKGKTLATQMQITTTLTPCEIIEKTDQVGVPYSPVMLAKAESTTISPGEIDITAIVEVKYLY